MAATDTFENSIAQMTAAQRQMLSGFIAQTREQILMARSEDARLRLLAVYFEEAHNRLQGVR